MNIDERMKLITQNTDEVITEENLKTYLQKDMPLKHYIGFEISGKIHIGTGLMAMYKVKDLMEAGVDTTIFLADWHTWINDKLGGDKKIIREVGVEYYKEGFKASMKAVGGDPDNLNFVTGFDLYHESDQYWETVVDVSKNTTLSRMQRSIDIAGREAGEGVDFAKLMYPAMQVADIFYQGVHIAHSGMDQRKAHVIARDVAMNMETSPLTDNDGNKIKPIALHHPLILGLGKPPQWPLPKDNLRDVWVDMKMSKSKPDTAVFITDSTQEIEKKIQGAFCPEGEAEFNPVMDWAKHVLFVRDDYEMDISRPEKWGGDLHYATYDELEKDYIDKALHPQDLKVAVARDIAKILEPAREHFASGKNKILKEKMDEVVVTR